MSLRDDDYNAYLGELKTELTAGHPTTGAYAADSQAAADQINALNRDVSQLRNRNDLWEDMLTLGAGVLARLVDDAANREMGETDLPLNGFTRNTRYEQVRLNPSTAEFIGAFQGNLASTSGPINMQADPYDSMLSKMADDENTLSTPATNAVRALCDATVGRATELWGCDSVEAGGIEATVLQLRETVITTALDVSQARAL